MSTTDLPETNPAREVSVADNSAGSEDAGIAASMAAPTPPTPPGELRRIIFFLSLALLIIPFSEGVYGLPFTNLLKTKLHLDPQAVAAFGAVASFPWNLKVLAGLLTDSFPLFGTRRRHYLLISIGVAICAGGLIAVVPETYAALLTAYTLFMAALMFANVVAYSLLVEKGQEMNSTGQLSSLRFSIGSLGGLALGPLAGFLATRALGWSSLVSSIPLVILGIAGFLIIRESPLPEIAARTNRSVWSDAWREIKSLGRSRGLWTAAAMMFLFFIAPGFGTLLYFYQTDKLGFSPQFIGNLGVISSITAFIGAAIYPYFARRMRLGPLLVACIVINAVLTLSYLFYHSREASYVIEALGGFTSSFTLLPLYDLAARATPRRGEGMGYAVILSIRNIAASLSDVLGASLYKNLHLSFSAMVWINAGTSLLALLIVPLVPLVLLRVRDREQGSAPS